MIFPLRGWKSFSYGNSNQNSQNLLLKSFPFFSACLGRSSITKFIEIQINLHVKFSSGIHQLAFARERERRGLHTICLGGDTSRVRHFYSLSMLIRAEHRSDSKAKMCFLSSPQNKSIEHVKLTIERELMLALLLLLLCVDVTSAGSTNKIDKNSHKPNRIKPKRCIFDMCVVWWCDSRERERTQIRRVWPKS